MGPAVVTDIEGTTTSLAFVKDVLFPFARERMAAFVAAHAREPDVAELLRSLPLPPGAGDEGARALLIRYIDEDKKDTVLKAIQGRIWREGYESGAFVSHVYPDVAPALARWRAAGARLYVFSSGSVEAQKLLFGHTQAGDLGPLFSGFFDTTTGKKNDPASYRAIAASISHAGSSPAIGPSSSITFLSDTIAELDAAREAGFATYGVRRPEDAAPPIDPGTHRIVASFDDVTLAF